MSLNPQLIAALNPDTRRFEQFGRELWLAAWMVAICWEEEAHTALVHSTLRDEYCPICGEVRVGPLPEL